MDREELSRRYRSAQFRSQAIVAEQASQDTPTASEETEDQTHVRTLAEIMGLKRAEDVGPGLTDDDRLRIWSGLRPARRR